jgi:hypothetical protein
MLGHAIPRYYHIWEGFAMHIDQLPGEFLDRIHQGCEPLDPSDRRGYFNEVLALLNGCQDMPSHRVISDIIQLAQKKHNRNLSRAVKE